LGAALAFGSGLAALRNREKPKVSLRNLLSFRAALAFDSGLAALRNREKPKVSLRNLLSFRAALAFGSASPPYGTERNPRFPSVNSLLPSGARLRLLRVRQKAGAETVVRAEPQLHARDASGAPRSSRVCSRH
jgi:hypothetical protein